MFPILIVVDAKMQTDPVEELIVLASSSYIDGSGRRELALVALKEKKKTTPGRNEQRTKNGTRSR